MTKKKLKSKTAENKKEKLDRYSMFKSFDSKSHPGILRGFTDKAA